MRGSNRPRQLGIGLACACALMVALAANLWLRSAPQGSSGVTPDDLHAAYARVIPGRTLAPDLPRQGFDAARPGVRRLSYLGLMEYFAPRDGAAFDRMDGAAQKCLTTPNGCSAYVFHLARQRDAASFSFVNAAQADASGVDVLFLIHDGRVAYKAIEGM